MYKNTHTLCRDNQKEAQAAERLWQKGFSQGGDQDPNGHSERALVSFCRERTTFQKDNHFCSTPPIRPLWYSDQSEATP